MLKGNLELVKTSIKDAALSSFRFYNGNLLHHLFNEELEALEKLSKKNKVAVQEADKDSSVVLVDRNIYINHLENILKNETKFEKV